MSEHEEKSKKSDISAGEIEKLAAIVNAAVTAAMKEGAENTHAMAKTIAEALVEARKPYVSPQDVANREAARKSSREQAAKQKSIKDWEQGHCPHVKGSNPNSFRSDPYDSAVQKHLLDTGEVIGICSNCTKVFSSLNPEDYQWLTAKSTNQVSMAGRREFADSNAAKRARLGLDQKEIFVDSDGNLVDHDPRKKEVAAAK
jgi:hypothetical protein